MECFLVVALTINGHVVTRSFQTYSGVPKDKIEMVMAIEAGRNSAGAAQLIALNSVRKYTYGYNCGEGWVNKGVAEDSVF